ncbi:class I SAM-dependent methyltransferase [Rubellimicrobium sp. CFH 75288]|uniref:class I SAM-dependent methyltransferase n=1 Tax=Rubellimicrobium sp. CFH 75288 TaxID=2697034 RepID=UPI0014125A9A|nr:SAM-dependent methyltransferase [Rubellimicrobium sp. CFH 75288]NAZ37447.1 class I SAM-dependent methyltransferase [Rubellimicrobium sp. CFH 75288]
MTAPTLAETPLAGLLAARIRAEGPLTVADFMAECLLHPAHGYYTTRDPLGARGDFTTAPEISQIFGELLALALAQAWLDQGAPRPVLLAELGPGRGTLMADALRALAVVPALRDAVRVHLVEASPALRAEQARRLPGATWHDRLDTLPEGPLLLLANEFLDALPVRQFLRQGPLWAERVVGLDPAGRLAWGLRRPLPVPALDHRLADTRDGDMVETRPALAPLVGEIGRRIAAHGGAAILVDYGGWRLTGDTLQALRAHAPADPLAHPGEADLTAHVDFDAVARAAPPARATAMVEQGTLLARLGLGARAEALARGLSGPALAAHRAAVARLADPAAMGSLFKAIALHPPDAPPPPGFAP